MGVGDIYGSHSCFKGVNKRGGDKVRKVIAAVLLTAFLACTLFGCTPSVTGVDNLMRPPKLSGENAGIQEAFERATANRTVKMKTPTTGDYRSAYVLYDLDADGVSEVITFYCDADDETAVYMHVLDRKDDRWESVADIKGKGSEVDKIDFCDMNGDGVCEIVVCWSLFESRGSKILTIYTSAFGENNGAIRELVSEPFSQMIHMDMNADGNDEVLLLTITSQNEKNRTTARILMMDTDFGIYCPGSIELVPALRVSSLQCQKAEKASDMPAAVFADCVIDENTAVTEVIYWDTAGMCLCAPLTKNNLSDAPRTARSAGLASADIDRDGLPEIPTTEPLANASSLNGEEEQPLELTVWLGFDGKQLQETQSCLMIYSSSYLFRFSKEEAESVTVVNNIPDRTCTFYQTEPDGSRGNILFELIVFPTTEHARRRPSDDMVLAESGALTYVCRISDFGAAHGITDAYLEAHFSLIQ